MRARLWSLWEDLSTSLWFVPALLTGVAVVLASTLTSVQVGAGEDPPGWLYNGSASEARGVLETLLSSLITLTTLAISITMVVLSLATSQLGPRLIRAFMGDRRTQFVLGIFLAAVVYVLLVLRQIDASMTDDEVPQLAVTVGTMTALACLGLLFFFVHHLGRSVVADSVVQRVGADLDASISRILPELDETPPADAAFDMSGSAGFGLPEGGYVQTVDYEALVASASEANAVIELCLRPGHHILPGGVHFLVAPANALDDALAQRLRSAIIVGSERTPVQDIEFGMRQLVEVALRALSPGINDPNTAIAVIDRIAMSMALVIARQTLPRTLRDREGRLRLLRPVSTFAGLMDVAFNHIRQAGETMPAILIRQLEALANLSTLARSSDQRKEIAIHAAMALAAARRTVAEPRDLAAVEEAYARIPGIAPLQV